ncbi:hypothetical protein [Niallia sp. NCCP-28]|uniref:hypothetical protein n=1 Tax=Niallia sp. NCCP-28 TaxID=2934712 RepID=UPI002084DD04|nr:hypothetical protein [Niallia sp. NCCP-28]GKU82935.1 hypothetical protein NCCP28_23310 [Niallia sp. NCCP-28]
MKKYIYFFILFGFFFPLFQKSALAIDNLLSTKYSILIGYKLYGLDSITNWSVSALAALLSYFLTNVFLNWNIKIKNNKT